MRNVYCKNRECKELLFIYEGRHNITIKCNKCGMENKSQLLEIDEWFEIWYKQQNEFIMVGELDLALAKNKVKHFNVKNINGENVLFYKDKIVKCISLYYPD